MRRQGGRTVVAYVGTDHGLTEPDVLRRMRSDGVEVRLMRTYHGIFHPKVLWLSGPSTNLLWVGSNNITRDGLLHNVEFATLISSKRCNPDLDSWFRNVHLASETFADSLLDSYEAERRAFAAKRSSVGTFTWSQREEPPTTPSASRTRSRRRPQRQQAPARRGRTVLGQSNDLVVEIMPRETGLDGKQIQLPKNAAVRFFGLPNQIGASRQVTLTPVGTADARTLTMTVFENNTTRLSLTELDYRDRPCVIVFHPQGNRAFAFEIVQQSIFPGRYRRLIGLCGNQTRTGSRRWAIL
jgi:hypothetical protein